jgi:2,3-bisphosphoglycerate-dependent phosphoglycerate mutase
MHLYLIRHGQSTNNHLLSTTGAEIGRSFDPELTDIGRQQAEHLAQYLRAWEKNPDIFYRPLTHLYCSPMTRAVRTGLPVARALGLPLTAWKDIHEGGGLYLYDEETKEWLGQPGPDRAAMQARYPDLVWPAEMGDGPWWNRSAEAPEERVPRARRVLAELMRRHPTESSDGVAFITHGAFVNYFMSALMGLEAHRAPIWFLLNNTGFICIELRPEREPAILFANRLVHLPPELITE